ncbi:hypothetical protein U0070_004941 [Myodes glareolus]|uniref:C2H2-type domain-containing protein n=1 Tax=Myodes glareolus TaxID=447135 RepID=A0AAW0K3T8_MYOGA
MAAALTDMADLEELSRLSPLPPGSPGSAARGRVEPPEEDEEEDDDEVEAEAVAALLLNGGAGGGAGGGEAETMSEPSPESASQAGGDEDDEEEDDEDEGSSSGGAEEESSAESLVGSSSGGCSGDETRSLSPGAASSSSGDGDGKEGLEEPKGPRGGPGGPGSGGGSSSSSVVSSGGDEGYGTGGGGSSATSGGRRGSLEMSSDGEPLSRMDSEDSISSTLMDVDSTISSGRSTPAMMNGQGSTTSSSKHIAYNCCWDQCQACFNSSPDLADHIRSIHVFVCLWKGCKVYNTPSTSQSWLQRHMLTHSGDKPFKCVVGGCNASFASQGGLARHVPTHFSQQNSSKVSSQPKAKEESPSKAGMNKRRKLKNKRRRSLPRPHDFFDAQTLDAIRHRAICFNLSAHIESLGKGHSVVFHSTNNATEEVEENSDKKNVQFVFKQTVNDICNQLKIRLLN